MEEKEIICLRHSGGRKWSNVSLKLKFVPGRTWGSLTYVSPTTSVIGCMRERKDMISFIEVGRLVIKWISQVNAITDKYHNEFCTFMWVLNILNQLYMLKDNGESLISVFVHENLG